MTASDSFRISIRYDDELQEQLKAGKSDPLVWIDDIHAGEEFLVGGENEGMKEYSVSFLTALLRACRKILNDEKEMVTTGNGPVYFVFNSVSEDIVEITVYYSKEDAQSYEEPKSYEPSAKVDKEKFVKEIIKTSNELMEYSLDINPALENGSYQGLADEIRKTKKYFD